MHYQVLLPSPSVWPWTWTFHVPGGHQQGHACNWWIMHGNSCVKWSALSASWLPSPCTSGMMRQIRPEVISSKKKKALFTCLGSSERIWGSLQLGVWPLSYFYDGFCFITFFRSSILTSSSKIPVCTKTARNLRSCLGMSWKAVSFSNCLHLSRIHLFLFLISVPITLIIQRSSR